MTPQPDMINHPPHYTYGGIEVIDVIDLLGMEFYEAQVFKYVARWKRKGGLRDLKKAQWYLNRLISNTEKKAEDEGQPVEGDGLYVGVDGSKVQREPKPDDGAE